MWSWNYPVADWLHDHHLGGRTILPAVESMRLAAVAFAAHRAVPPVSACSHAPNAVHHARFLRLIEIAAGQTALELIVESAQAQDGTLVTLSRRIALRGMTRLLLCSEMELVREEDSPGPLLPVQPDKPGLLIPAARLYRELVPFGPAFQSLAGEVWLTAEEAGGVVHAPAYSGGLIGADWLGSPFPLDGAMHMACVHGQRLVDFVPFPVAFRRRRVYQATRPGQRYQVQVRLRQQEPDRLIYDLWLWHEEALCEELQGLEMRDVSAGQRRPPEWLRS